MSNNSPAPFKTLIVDDEPMARATIRLLLKDDSEIEIAGEIGNGFEAVNAIRKLKPHLVFLDVQMPEKNGFEVLNDLDEEELPCIVFVTAYDKYALRAFEVNAIDYLLKPFDDERFKIALQRAKTQLRQRQGDQLNHRLHQLLETYQKDRESSAEPAFLQRLAIKSTGRIYFLNVDEIDWIEAADQYVQLYCAKKVHLLRQSMSTLESRLDPQRFYRIHRSVIVNIDRIKELQPASTGDYYVILKDNTQLKLSRNRREQLQKILGWF